MKHIEIITISTGLEIHCYLDVNDTNRQLSLFKAVIHPNAKVPAAHYHDHFDETIYCLKGTIALSVDGKAFEMSVGECYFIPRGAVHKFENKSEETVEVLCFANPGVFGADYFKDIAAVINAGGSPDMMKIKEVMLSHGLVPVLG